MSKYIKADGFLDSDETDYTPYKTSVYINPDYIVRFKFTTLADEEVVFFYPTEPSGLRTYMPMVSYDVDSFKQLAEITDTEPVIHLGKSFKKMSGKDLNNYE